MRRFFGGKTTDAVLAAVAMLVLWQALTLYYPEYIVPAVASVGRRLAAILSSRAGFAAIGTTFLRLLAGVGVGVGVGSVLGILFGSIPRLGRVFRPLIGVMQSVPPISWLVMALIWFGFDGAASVFIVVVTTLPVMIVGLVEGIAAIDPRLLQMGRVYRFGRGKALRRIVLPSLKPHFRSAARIAVGLGAKAVVMGEALSTVTGIGGALTDARLNVDPAGVVAWTLVVVVLFHLFDRLVLLLLADRRGGREGTC